MELLTLQGLRPARSWRPGCDSAVLPVYKKCERGLLQVVSRHHLRPRPQQGQGWRKGSNHIFKNRVSTELKNYFFRRPRSRRNIFPARATNKFLRHLAPYTPDCPLADVKPPPENRGSFYVPCPSPYFRISAAVSLLNVVFSGHKQGARSQIKG